MRISFGLCLAALLLGSSSLFGQTTNADAEKALSKGQDAFEDDKSNAAIRPVSYTHLTLPTKRIV